MKHHADAARESAINSALHKPARKKEPPKLNDAQREYIIHRLAADEMPTAMMHKIEA